MSRLRQELSVLTKANVMEAWRFLRGMMRWNHWGGLMRVRPLQARLHLSLLTRVMVDAMLPKVLCSTGTLWTMTLVYPS